MSAAVARVRLAGMNVIFAVVLAVLFAGPLLVHFWPAIEALSGGAAAFLGALVGAAAGLGAILGGALYNAKLNRDENKRLRREDGRALALALRGEMLSVADSYRRHKKILFDTLQRAADFTEDETTRLCTTSACSIAIFSKSSDRTGLLEDPELIADLAQFYPILPTEIENTDVKVEQLRKLSQGREKLDDVMIDRATNLAEKLKTAAERLAPRP